MKCAYCGFEKPKASFPMLGWAECSTCVATREGMERIAAEHRRLAMWLTLGVSLLVIAAYLLVRL